MVLAYCGIRKLLSSLGGFCSLEVGGPVVVEQKVDCVLPLHAKMKERNAHANECCKHIRTVKSHHTYDSLREYAVHSTFHQPPINDLFILSAVDIIVKKLCFTPEESSNARRLSRNHAAFPPSDRYARAPVSAPYPK